MEKNDALNQLDELIKMARASRETISSNHPLVIFWHTLLGVCFLSSFTIMTLGWQSNFHALLWGGLVSAGWAITLFQARKDSTDDSATAKKFRSIWISVGLTLTAIGFSSLIDSDLFSAYPFLFGFIMSALQNIIGISFNLSNLKIVAAVWAAASVVSIFLPSPARFLIIGILCILTPLLHLWLGAANKTERR